MRPPVNTTSAETSKALRTRIFLRAFAARNASETSTRLDAAVVATTYMSSGI
jgi:hypothetical protein